MVRAIVVNRFALVAFDLLEISPTLEAAVRDQLPFPCFVVATHTHSGPGGTDPDPIAELLGEGPYVPSRPGQLAEAAAETIGMAVARRRAAVLRFGQARHPELQEERDPGGTADPTLSVLAADGLDHHRIATLAVYGAHPTLLPRGERLLSADWPGAAAATLEKTGGVAMVLQGAGGDASVPRAGLPSDPGTQIAAFGQHVADAVENVISAGSPVAPGPTAVAQAVVGLPAPDLSRFLGPFHGLADRLFELWAPRAATVSVALLGAVTLTCVPGELTGAARTAWPADQTIISLCGGDVSYIESPALWQNRRGEPLALLGPSLLADLLAGDRMALDAARAVP
ncbi:MAG TPA: hypothetical protein VMB50_02430 [Myxococcales bacterium]|nr:hypothetical protein [Myxococcales bacterium]